LPSEIAIRVGIGPRKSSSVWSLMAALVVRKRAQRLNAPLHLSTAVVDFENSATDFGRFHFHLLTSLFEIRLPHPMLGKINPTSGILMFRE